MQIRSPLSSLAEVLATIRDYDKSHENMLCNNEDVTRMVLIDPVLRALGWDTSRPNMVEVEHRHKKVKLDYALFDPNGDVVVIIEAKSLGKNLYGDDIYMQVVDYAFQRGAKHVYLTDGIRWLYHEGFDPQNRTPDVVIDLAKDNLIEAATKLVQNLDAAKYWSEELTIDELAEKIGNLESTVASLQAELFALRGQVTAILPTPITSPTPPHPIDQFQDLSLLT